MIRYHIIVLERLLMPSHSHIHISFLILPRLTKTKASLCPSSYLIMNHRKRFHCNNYVFIYLYYIQNYNLTTETAIRNLANGDMGWIAFDLCVCVCVCVCVSVIWWYRSACLALLALLVCLQRLRARTHTQTNINQPKSQIQNSFTPDLTHTRDLNKICYK